MHTNVRSENLKNEYQNWAHRIKSLLYIFFYEHGCISLHHLVIFAFYPPLAGAITLYTDPSTSLTYKSTWLLQGIHFYIPHWSVDLTSNGIGTETVYKGLGIYDRGENRPVYGVCNNGPQNRSYHLIGHFGSWIWWYGGYFGTTIFTKMSWKWMI